RSTASILAPLGLSESIAASPEDYARLGVRCAEDRETIAELRRTLRGRMRTAPLMAALRLALAVGDAHRRMWRAWCGWGGRGRPHSRRPLPRPRSPARRGRTPCRAARGGHSAVSCGR